MHNISLAFWDWNGTLWDDVEQWFIAAKAAYAHAKIDEEITLERLKDAFDVPVSEVIHTLGAPRDLPQENHEALLDTFRNTLAKHDHLSKTRRGAHDVLDTFEAQSIQNFVASNHPLDLLKKDIEKSGLSRFFDVVCGNDNHDTVYTKGTKEERIKERLTQTKILPSQACVIADTREEIRIAKKFGMISIAVTGGYNSEKVLREMRPDHLVHDLTDIPRLFAS